MFGVCPHVPERSANPAAARKMLVAVFAGLLATVVSPSP